MDEIIEQLRGQSLTQKAIPYARSANGVDEIACACARVGMQTPPGLLEMDGGSWRDSCALVEQRAHEI